MPRTKKEHIISKDEKQAADLQIKEMQKQIDYDTRDFTIELLITKFEKKDFFMMLSRLVDTFFSRTSWTMLLYAENHSISVA